MSGSSVSSVSVVVVEKNEDGSILTSNISSSSSSSASSASYLQLQEDLTAQSSSLEDHTAKHQSSNVTAFVTLLKALFGVSLLSSPRVLGETGLVLGTLVYSWIVLACVGSCWCLLQARAKVASAAAQAQAAEAEAAAAASEAAEEQEVVESKRPSLESAYSQLQQEAILRPPHSEAITYGDLGRTLLGAKQSVLINFLIVSLHICFGAGLVATSIHQIAVVLGWEEDTNQDDGEEDEIWLAGRALLAAAFFPLIAFLLQFRSIQDLFWVCLAGIIVFVVGCVGTMLYSTILVDNDGDGNVIWDIPHDALEWKFSGIPNFVASTLCAMEGINLALPIANHFYLAKSPTRTASSNKNNLQQQKERSPVPVVTAAVGCFGIITLLVAYFGYLSGLGGGSGTQHEDDDEETEDCPFVAHCLDSAVLETIHRLSLTAALILTLPIILYPSLELLERWAEERHWQLLTGRTSSNRTIGDSWNGFVFEAPSDSLRRKLNTEQTLFGTEPFFPCLHRHWRLRLGHAAAVCLIAIVDRPWERALVLFKGIGLSIACFLLPVILFVRAHSVAIVLQQPVLTAALGGLMALGLVNLVLVILSVFTEHNFLPTEVLHDDPLGHHHHSQDSHDSHDSKD